ncbi:MAG: NAD(P)H-quinone oxidoreductase [Chloroflexi bacterium]|nr:NAD(P)H-quinone oxidoreductase [Chloroflexota bacterium]
MKAIVLPRPGPPEVLEYRDIPEPTPGPEDLLVRVRAAGLNRADSLQRRGGYPQPGPKTEFEVLGMEFAGEVIGLGDRVEGFAAGDRVMGILAGACYAEQVVIHQRLAMRVPGNLSWYEAAGTPEVYVTAHDALLQCSFQAGESALIHACGSGVGVAAIQIAKVMGASFVAGTAGADAKLAQAKALGLDLGVNYRTGDFAAEVLAATGGRGVDAVLDVIGAGYLEKNLQSLAPRGRLVFVGLMGGAVAPFNIGLMLAKRLQFRGTTLRSRPLEEKASTIRAFEKSVLPHIASGRVKVVVDRVFPLAEAAAAHVYLESNANFGKVILDVG